MPGRCDTRGWALRHAENLLNVLKIPEGVIKPCQVVRYCMNAKKNSMIELVNKVRHDDPQGAIDILLDLLNE